MWRAKKNKKKQKKKLVLTQLLRQELCVLPQGWCLHPAWGWHPPPCSCTRAICKRCSGIRRVKAQGGAVGAPRHTVLLQGTGTRNLSARRGGQDSPRGVSVGLWSPTRPGRAPGAASAVPGAWGIVHTNGQGGAKLRAAPGCMEIFPISRQKVILLNGQPALNPLTSHPLISVIQIK